MFFLLPTEGALMTDRQSFMNVEERAGQKA
jgi:hypothetical protein